MKTLLIRIVLGLLSASAVAGSVVAVVDLQDTQSETSAPVASAEQTSIPTPPVSQSAESGEAASSNSSTTAVREAQSPGSTLAGPDAADQATLRLEAVDGGEASNSQPTSGDEGESVKPEKEKKEEPAKTEKKKEEPAKTEKKKEPAKTEEKKEEPAKTEKKKEPAKTEEKKTAGNFDAVVRPGQSIQQVVDGLPAGSSVLIKAGTHVGQQVKPKSGMTFVGEKGAVMDGRGTTRYAFLAWEENASDNVTIRGLEIKNYAPIPAMAAINSHRSGWVVEDCHVHHTKVGSGIRIHDNGVIRNCVVHHNDRLGLKPSGNNIRIEGNTVYSNNHNDLNDPKWEAGGIKGGGNGLVFRNNHVYGNHGHGIWVDEGATDVLYEGNLVENNTYSGINHEISSKAVIRRNTIRGNGHGDSRNGWLWGAGIQVRGPNVEIYGNRIERNKHGVGLMQTDRGSQYNVKNVYVHGNVIVESGHNGAVRSAGPTDIFTTSRFEDNEYRYKNLNAAVFRWNDKKGNYEWWRAQGQS